LPNDKYFQAGNGKNLEQVEQGERQRKLTELLCTEAPGDQGVHDKARRAIHDVAGEYRERVAASLAQV
jgi:hypothetical protein